MVIRIHSGTNKNIYFKIFSFGSIVCSCQRVSTSEDKVRVFYAINKKLNNRLRNFKLKNINEYARTPQPREIVFDTMRYRRNETVQKSGDFDSK